MDIVRARGQDPETCRELFILAAEILGVAAYSGSALSARLDELRPPSSSHGRECNLVQIPSRRQTISVSATTKRVGRKPHVMQEFQIDERMTSAHHLHREPMLATLQA